MKVDRRVDRQKKIEKEKKLKKLYMSFNELNLVAIYSKMVALKNFGYYSIKVNR